MDLKTDSKEKITLPKNLQREMIKFFLRTSRTGKKSGRAESVAFHEAKSSEVPKIAANDRQRQQTSPNTNNGGC